MAGTELASAYISLFPKLKTNEIEAQLKGIKVDGAGAAAGNSFGTSFGKAFKALAGAWIVKEAAQAFISLGSSALSAYASYEQLVGGVDTLFKESSAQLQEYAANAYKTAGMSANQYMELSTGFAASLIQSLGGDTAKAADYANMAITDMSDNANKMGTSMEMIQNAYQGFAKQNYTMLDNLKLGYGGTQAEMQRLLADAEKLSGIHYDISSYADVVDAIHVIQTEMGISGITAEEAAAAIANGTMTAEEAFEAMGTTAKEAATTIEGSLGMAKASWSNWLAGLANEEANLEGLTNQLIDSVVTAASNIAPRIMQILTALGAALVTQLPILLGEFNAALSAGGVDMMSAALGLFGSILTALLQATPQILQACLLMLASLVVALGNYVGEFAVKGLELMKGVASGIGSGAAHVVSEIGRGISEGVARVKNSVSGFVQAGKDLVAGMARGVSSAAGEVWEAIKRICQNSLDRIKSFFGIASPSKVMREMFGYVGEGMALGLEDKSNRVIGAMTSVAEGAKNAASFSAAPQLATTGAGYGSTTINLYCDIKDLQGIQTLNDLYGMLSRARAINPTKNRR